MDLSQYNRGKVIGSCTVHTKLSRVLNDGAPQAKGENRRLVAVSGPEDGWDGLAALKTR